MLTRRAQDSIRAIVLSLEPWLAMYAAALLAILLRGRELLSRATEDEYAAELIAAT